MAMSSLPTRMRAGASALSPWASSYPGPQAQSHPRRAAQKPMCSDIPELCLSFMEEHWWLYRIVFKVNSIFAPPSTIKLLDSCKPSPRPSLVVVVRVLPTAAAQRPLPFSLSVASHRTPLP
ncbi:Os11g0602850 [Oryza sativa Japonica Group]|uniref:Os11g0602850 protein n=1 Tax=Oryza sativa subsp. japonica TaxID=39947 RepID=A0A0P0Y490_ORYSJ|nr:Os11g0602850 [Oryza sativa Japonica Group]